MTEFTIINNPIILILYSIALCLCVLEVVKKFTGYILQIISAVIVIATSAYAIFWGVNFYEVGCVLIIFLILNLLSFGGVKKWHLILYNS